MRAARAQDSIEHASPAWCRGPTAQLAATSSRRPGRFSAGPITLHMWRNSRGITWRSSSSGRSAHTAEDARWFILSVVGPTAPRSAPGD